MSRFMLGMTVVFGVLFAFGLFVAEEWLRNDREELLHLAAVVLVAPLAAGWAGAMLVERWRPRRWFDERVRVPALLFVRGVGAGLLAAGAAAMVIGFVDGWVADAGLVGGFAFASSAAFVLRMPRKRADECVHCGHNVRHDATPRCAACGALGSRGAATAEAAEA